MTFSYLFASAQICLVTEEMVIKYIKRVIDVLSVARTLRIAQGRKRINSSKLSQDAFSGRVTLNRSEQVDASLRAKIHACKDDMLTFYCSINLKQDIETGVQNLQAVYSSSV